MQPITNLQDLSKDGAYPSRRKALLINKGVKLRSDLGQI